MKFLKGLFLLILPAALSHADDPAVHGMLLFGKDVVYASHLPMFHPPHDYQLIMKLRLSDADPRTLEKYKKAKDLGEGLFTLEPEVMDLTELKDGSKKSFKATLYKGHFERGGQPLGKIIAQVESIVRGEKLEPSQSTSRNEEYIVFGQRGEYFAAHIIRGKPSYDAVLSVLQPLSHNAICMRYSCIPEGPIADDELPVIVSAPKSVPETGDNMGDVHHITTTVKAPIYYEKDELTH